MRATMGVVAPPGGFRKVWVADSLNLTLTLTLSLSLSLSLTLTLSLSLTPNPNWLLTGLGGGFF